MADTDIEEKWKARLERERAARKEAEKLLEDKAAELYNLNQSLQKKVEEEVAKSKERESFLAEQSKLASMGEMIGNIAHQWRQPLSAITSTASALKLSDQLGILEDGEISIKTDAIINKANFLSNTIDDFRNFFKSDKQKVEFNIKDVIRNIENIVLATYTNNHIQIIKDLPKNEIVYLGLPGELSQVILNLLNNAKDILIEKNSAQKVVHIDVYETNNMFTIKVCDNGGGVPSDIIGKIFEPYFTTKHKSQGTGIGLYMSREIIRNHFNGQIYVKNKTFKVDGEEYFGACFTIEIDKSTCPVIE